MQTFQKLCIALFISFISASSPEVGHTNVYSFTILESSVTTTEQSKPHTFPLGIWFQIGSDPSQTYTSLQLGTTDKIIVYFVNMTTALKALKAELKLEETLADRDLLKQVKDDEDKKQKLHEILGNKDHFELGDIIVRNISKKRSHDKPKNASNRPLFLLSLDNIGGASSAAAAADAPAGVKVPAYNLEVEGQILGELKKKTFDFKIFTKIFEVKGNTLVLQPSEKPTWAYTHERAIDFKLGLDPKVTVDEDGKPTNKYYLENLNLTDTRLTSSVLYSESILQPTEDKPSIIGLDAVVVARNQIGIGGVGNKSDKKYKIPGSPDKEFRQHKTLLLQSTLGYKYTTSRIELNPESQDRKTINEQLDKVELQEDPIEFTVNKANSQDLYFHLIRKYHDLNGTQITPTERPTTPETPTTMSGPASPTVKGKGGFKWWWILIAVGIFLVLAGVVAIAYVKARKEEMASHGRFSRKRDLSDKVEV